MELIIPLIIVFFIIFALIKKVKVFDAFLFGAKEGLYTVYTIAPTLVGLVAAVTMLSSSGVLDILAQLISPLAEKLGFPAEIVPVAVLRPISGGGSTALLVDILERFGPDSFVGRIVSVMAGATETTFYAVAVYFGSVGIKKIRHTLLCGLLADFTAVVFSVLTVRLFYS
ncbi:MAG: nucleoside recognition domain-containing protein [Eubacteriales bacterium]|nr:nucleoside recognition domain-containing protein [Eubacteriales bacterium]